MICDIGSTMLTSVGRLANLCLLVCAAIMISPAAAQSISIESQLQIEKSESVRISNIDDWFIGAFNATSTIPTIQYNNWDAQCVYTSTGRYSVEVRSQNGGAQLTLESSSGDQMNYWIYSYSRRGNNYQMRGHTDTLFNLNNRSGSQSLTCADENVVGTNLWFTALVRPDDFNAAAPGVYRDVVTLMVVPE